MTSLPPTRITAARFVAGAPSAAAFPSPIGVEIAFAGRSNVGKSTLLNGLMQRKNLARTSSTPGATRQINFFEVETGDGARLTLADLPGYGYAKRSKGERAAWGPLMEAYLLERTTLAAVVLIVDPRRGLEEDEENLLKMLADAKRPQGATLPALLVATKMDRLGAAKRKPALETLRRQSGRVVLGFSPDDPAARDALWGAIRKAAGL